MFENGSKIDIHHFSNAPEDRRNANSEADRRKGKYKAKTRVFQGNTSKGSTSLEVPTLAGNFVFMSVLFYVSTA